MAINEIELLQFHTQLGEGVISVIPTNGDAQAAKEKGLALFHANKIVVDEVEVYYRKIHSTDYLYQRVIGTKFFTKFRPDNVCTLLGIFESDMFFVDSKGLLHRENTYGRTLIYGEPTKGEYCFYHPGDSTIGEVFYTEPAQDKILEQCKGRGIEDLVLLNPELATAWLCEATGLKLELENTSYPRHWRCAIWRAVIQDVVPIIIKVSYSYAESQKRWYCNIIRFDEKALRVPVMKFQ